MLKALKQTNKFNNDRIYWFLLISSWLVYVFTIVAKSIYNAEVIEIMKTFNINKTVAGYGTTAYYLTYGFMQLVIAKILPKINLRKYVVVTVTAASICTALVGIASEIWQICILLGLCGIFHAAVWPGCVAIMGNWLPLRMQPTANALFSIGFATGFIVSYLFSALFIGFASWTITFLVFGIGALIPTILFNISFKKVSSTNESVTQTNEDRKNTTPSFERINHKIIKNYLMVFFTLVCVTSFLVNIAYYGINNWMPSLMYDVFNMPSSLSTLVSVLVPVIGIIGPLIAIRCTDKHNLWGVTAVFLSSAGLLILLLSFGYNINIVLSLASSVIALTMLRGSNNNLGVSLVLRARNLFNAGSFAAIINALASLGASVAPPLTGSIIDNFGRSAYYMFLFAVLLISVILVFILNKITKRLRILKNTVLEK